MQINKANNRMQSDFGKRHLAALLLAALALLASGCVSTTKNPLNLEQEDASILINEIQRVKGSGYVTKLFLAHQGRFLINNDQFIGSPAKQQYLVPPGDSIVCFMVNSTHRSMVYRYVLRTSIKLEKNSIYKIVLDISEDGKEYSIYLIENGSRISREWKGKWGPQPQFFQVARGFVTGVVGGQCG